MENNFQFTSAAVSDRGLSEKRPQNEDSYLELNKSGLFAVADGVGGAQAGDVASQMAVEILSEAFVNMRPNGDAEEVMKLGIEKANSAIFQMSHDLAQLSTMATTIVALHLQGNIATVGHVGDSRLYRLDGNGNLYRETQDHSIVEEEVRAGRMTPAQAANHPSRNVISRALGAEQTVEIDLKTIMFEPNAAFLLCSDGITRHLEDYEIRDLLNSDEDPGEICGQMKKICYQRGAEDNLTAVVIKVSNEVAPAVAEKAYSEDHDEATVATARPPQNLEQTNRQNFADHNGVEFDDAETKDLKFPADDSFNTDYSTSNQINELPFEGAENQALPAAGIIAPIIAEPAIVDTKPQIIEKPVENEIIHDEKTYRIENKSAAGIISKIFGSILLLIIGAILGIGIYYFAFAQKVEQQAIQPVPIKEMKSPNIDYTSLEDNRRNVDKNPELFISGNTSSPKDKDAEDYFLLGRAYLLTGKYAEAKQALTEAKNHLAQAKDVNSKTLANEIAIEMAIINDPFAQKSFEKDILTSKGEAANTSTNSQNTGNATNSTNLTNSANLNSNK